MSLTALPVTVSDLTQLQQGIEFFTNTAEATAQAATINAPGTSSSVFTYATQLLANNISLSQVAMADTAIMEGGTVAVGDATTSNTLTLLSTVFLPNQVANALAHGFNPTVYAAEALGLALASTAGFNTNFAGLNTSAFVSAVGTATGVNANAITGFVANWTTFFTNNPNAHLGLTVQQAAYGAAFGDSIGVALLNPTSANLQTIVSTQSPQTPTQFSPNTVKGLVANALIGNAEGQYVTGVTLGALPAHTPLQGEFNQITTPTNVFLTAGVDNATQGFSSSATGTPLLNGFTATASNTTFNSTFGGAGATWTAGDQVTANTGTTGQVFNITGNGALGVINVTNLPTNKVSGIQTVNINANTVGGAASTEAVQGDFTATGPMKEWTGLTALNITSGGNAIGADLVTVGAATAVQITDSLISTPTQALTVNGSLTTTINENNDFVNPGIAVNGGSGTTTVSITQTQPLGTMNDGVVKILDANGASTTAAGTITAVLLDGLSHPVTATFVSNPNTLLPSPGMTVTGTILNTITDNALTSLTINHSDGVNGAALSIIDNLTTPTATTLALNLLADGIGATGFASTAITAFPGSSLVLVDAKNEISTIHLSLGAQNSALQLLDNGLATLDTPTAGTGALVGSHSPVLQSTITDHFAGAVTIDLSGLNGPNNVDIDRVSGVNNDVFTLGNFGTSNTNTSPGGAQWDTEQHLVIENSNANNTATIQWGSGAYDITDQFHNGTTNHHSYVNTAPNGAGLASGFPTSDQWALVRNAAPALSVAGSDTLQFKGDTSVQTVFNDGPQASIQAGITDALSHGAHTVTGFTFAGNTFLFDHVGTSGINVSPTDAMVEFVGIVYNALSSAPGGIIHLV